MRSLLLGFVVVWTTLIGGEVEAAPRAKTVRIVQIISMGGGAGPRSPTEPDAAAKASTSAGLPLPADDKALLDAFRTHDLSRRWVAFEMANNFAAAGSSTDRSAAAGSFANVAVGDLGSGGQATTLSPPPAVTIPDWMRRGLDFSAVLTSSAQGCARMPYQPSGFLAADAEYRRSGYYGMMSSIACEYGIPVGLFDALIIRESGYRADISSPKNAFGLTQLMPATAAGMGVNRYDIKENLRGGARYLRQQLDHFGQVHLALAAYNAGPGRVRNGLLPRIVETQAYVDGVLLNWRRLAGRTQAASMQSASVPMPRPVRIGRAATVSAF